MYSYGSKADAKTIGVDMLRQICAATSIPCVAIGGVNKENVHIALDSGAIGIAVISAVVLKKTSPKQLKS